MSTRELGRSEAGALTQQPTSAGCNGTPTGGPGRRAPLFLGESAAAQELRRQVALVAPRDSTVLIRGETGTGKGLLARLIHDESGRRERPFVHLDCTSLSPSLVESELFGHERGAFTGAAERRLGRFETASSGTIFLDEIGDMEPSLQAKLLRVLQDRRFERIGGDRALTMKARVVAATNRDLEQAIQRGEFRSDLYYRLRVVELSIPPLRERTGDLELLARRRVQQLRAQLGLRECEVEPGFYAALSRHGWPGNVRELDNFVERALVLHPGGSLTGDDALRLLNDRLLDDVTAESTPAYPLRVRLRPPHALERREPSARVGRLPPACLGALTATCSVDMRGEIEASLRASHWNVSRAARMLGVARSTLRYRIAQLRIHRPGANSHTSPEANSNALQGVDSDQ